ncbi:MAG: sulfurtransferase, partial [Desulfobacteraceae bacterium]|nr:sulfurtransferase [Desulfobacteraceae bacterium]
MFFIKTQKVLFFFILIFFFSIQAFSAEKYDISTIHAKNLLNNMKHWTIIDARPKRLWSEVHLPGALTFNWEEYIRKDEFNIPFRLKQPEVIAKALGKFGINENSPVVIYGDADTSWGGEGWICWMLVWLGHKGPIRLLNGGITQWVDLKYPLTGKSLLQQQEVTSYKYQVREKVNISTIEIIKNPGKYHLIDTRSLLEWYRGHLPGAVHISWKKFYKGKNRTPITSKELKKLLLNKGIELNKPIVYYCTGGI